jgi:hypothetical protein
MIDYASVAQEILETPLRQPDWVRERIRKSDGWMEELELLNLAESEKAPSEMRNDVAALADDLGVRVSQEAGAWRRTQALLDLVFECQEVLFELGGYRRLVAFDEKEGWL